MRVSGCVRISDPLAFSVMPRVITIVSDELLALRQRRGLDKFDEKWDGILHMVPPPETGHQRFGGRLETAIDDILGSADPDLFVAQNVAVADPNRWPEEFRVPDLTVCLGGEGVSRKYVSRADLVVEIRSPDDEAYEKLQFYAERSVEEILVIDRDAGIQLLHRTGKEFAAEDAAPGGWMRSGVGLEFRWDAAAAALGIRKAGEGGRGRSVAFPA